MKALGRRWFLLLLAAAAWAQDARVSVTCGPRWLSVAVPAAVLGNQVARGELTLGSGCGVTAAAKDWYWLHHPLVGCGTTLELLRDSVRYSNVLRYRPVPGAPVARARPFSLPVDCYYPRMGSVSSRAVQPTWVPFGSSVAHRRRLRSARVVYDNSRSSRLLQPLSDPRGDPINVEAPVGTDPPALPLRIFVDGCGATPGSAPRLSYGVTAGNGCPLGGQLRSPRSVAPSRDGFVRFQLQTSLRPNASLCQIYLRCHPKAVARGAGGTVGKPRSYHPVATAWHSREGAARSCCVSPVVCRRRRRRELASSRDQNPLGELRALAGDAGAQREETTVLLAPPELPSALPSSPPGVPWAPEPSTAPSHHPSVPVVRGKKQDWGPALPVPGTTLAMVAMCTVLVTVGITGCYCSLRRHRGGDAQAAPSEPRAVPMAPTAAAGARDAPGNPPGIV